MCGEQLLAEHLHQHLIGSPPRVRGTVRVVQRRIESEGITPACAGNREAVAAGEDIIEDHPRVCGEQDIYND